MWPFKTYHPWLFIALLACIACKKSFAPGELEDDQLVVLAEITAGDSVEVPIGKTLKVGSGNLIRFEKVNDATVVLIEDTSKSWILKPSFASQYSNNPTSVFTSRKRFLANTEYSVTIQHPTLGVAYAKTFIPPVPKLLSVDTAWEVMNDKNMLAATITWQDVEGREDLYVIEVIKELVTTRRDTLPQNKFIRIQLFTQDENAENKNIDRLSNPFRRIFFKDHGFDGGTYSTKVLIDPQFFTSSDPTQKGRVRLQFKAVSPELFNYLVLYEKYKTDFGSVPANQLTSPDGNIDNGIGVFGGSARRERIWYFDKL